MRPAVLPASSPGNTTRRSTLPDFNHIARPYRWMEYLTFGPLLERCRFAFLDQLEDPRNALILGDGDGRFLAQLLQRNPQLSVHVIDLSPTMLDLASARASAVGSALRITFHQADLRNPLPALVTRAAPFDLVTAHFLLDCLTTEEASSLIDRLLPLLAPDAAFVVSEFAIPPEQPFRFLGRLLVCALYQAFALLTHLTIRRLPAYATALQRAGFRLARERTFLHGILRSELWRLGTGVDAVLD